MTVVFGEGVLAWEEVDDIVRFAFCSTVNVFCVSFLPPRLLANDFDLTGVLGHPESAVSVLVLVLTPGSVELELRALADDFESRESVSLRELELIVLLVLVLDALLTTVDLLLLLSLELKNLNLSNIEFLLVGEDFKDCALAGVAGPVLAVVGILVDRLVLSPSDWLRALLVNARPPGVGIPDPPVLGDVALLGCWLLLLLLLLLFLEVNDEDPAKRMETA